MKDQDGAFKQGKRPSRRGTGPGRALLGGMEALEQAPRREDFRVGPVSFRFVRALEARSHGEEALLFERRLRQGPPGLVVVKRLRDPASFGMRQRLREEVMLAFRLHHPAIAQAHHFQVIDSAPHAILEYVDGPALDALLTSATLRGQPLPAAFAVYLAAEVADALHHAHTLTDEVGGSPLGIIHRDVSPRNIRVERTTGQVKLSDFGAAFSRRVGREETPRKLRKGDLLYAAPEYLFDAPMEARSDLFSLGLVLLEALTSQHLHAPGMLDSWEPGNDPVTDLEPDEVPDIPVPRLLALVESCTPEDVERATQALPPDLRDLLRALLQRAPSRRPESAAGVGRALRAWLHAEHPGYGRHEAVEDLERVIADASGHREVGEPTEAGLYSSEFDAHELPPREPRERR